METTKITIEDLAVKLNGKMWTKGDLKRIYLDRGYNTKKMSTKTYVQLSPSGMWDVKCFVECPSQDYNWCKSQAEQVIGSVENQINEILFDIDVETYTGEKLFTVGEAVYAEKWEENGVIISEGSKKVKIEFEDKGERIVSKASKYFPLTKTEPKMIKVNTEKLIDEAQEQSGTERTIVSKIINKMVIAFENDKFNILSRLNGFALYICYNYNCHHAITVVMNDRTKEIGYLHNSGGFLCFTGDDWMGDDTYTNLDVIPQNYFSSIE